MVRFMGDAEASKRFTTTADNVSQDENGLKQLIVSTPDPVYYVTPLDDPFASLSQASQNKSEEEEEEFLSLPPATTVTALPELEEAATSGKTAEEADSRNEETIITAEIGGKT